MTNDEKTLVGTALADIIAYIAERDPNASDFVRLFETKHYQLVETLLGMDKKPRAMGFINTRKETNE